MGIPRELRARRGDWILPKWVALLKFIERTNKIITGDGVRVAYLPSGGVHIYAEDNYSPWSSPFKVAIAGKKATVREGLVNGISPTIDDIRLDGRKDGGGTEKVPALLIESLGSDRSYVVIRLNFESDPVRFDPKNPESIIIEHVAELPETFSQGGSELNDNTAIYPLAVIYWKDSKTIRRVFQITHHNLNHRFVAGSATAGKPSRHLFWAA